MLSRGDGYFLKYKMMCPRRENPVQWPGRTKGVCVERTAPEAASSHGRSAKWAVLGLLLFTVYSLLPVLKQWIFCENDVGVHSRKISRYSAARGNREIIARCRLFEDWMFVNWESEKNQIIEKQYFPEAAFLEYFSPNALTIDLSIFKLLRFLHV